MQVHVAIKQNNHITWLNKLRGEIKQHNYNNLVSYANKYAKDNRLGVVILSGRRMHVPAQGKGSTKVISCRDDEFLQLEHIYLKTDISFDHVIWQLSRTNEGGNLLFMQEYFPTYMSQLDVIEKHYGDSIYYIHVPRQDAESSLQRFSASKVTSDAINFIKLYQMVMP